jgi:hypothetical protein
MIAVMKLVRGGYLVLLMLACSLLSAQQGRTNQARKSFTSPDGAFNFEYSDSLVSCRRDPHRDDWWLPDESCDAYTPVCSNFSCDSTGTIACIAYPASEMKGTTFQAAAFSVNERKEAPTESKCLKVEEPPPHVGNARNETVNGVGFKVTETDGVATGNLIDGYNYRTFHKGTCYELDIRIAFSNAVNYDPGTVKTFDSEKVERSLKKVLASFKFLR